MTFGEILRAQSKSLTLGCALLMVAGIAFFDHITSWDISLFVLYTIPIFLVGWTCPKSTAIGFVLFCSVLSWFVNLKGAPSMPLHSLKSINRLVSFSFVATAGIALRAQREHYRS